MYEVSQVVVPEVSLEAVPAPLAPAVKSVQIVPETRLDLVLNEHVAEVHAKETKDDDANGLPDYWEKKYFGETSVMSPESKSKQGLDVKTVYLLGLDPSTDDTDGDGETDVEELEKGSDPTKWDSRGDGMSDNEKLAWGLDSKKSDTDGDGIDDTVELASGSDPKNPNDKPVFVNDVPEEWAKQNDINPKQYALKTKVPGIDKEIQLSFAMVDTDGDGLTDAQELKYRTSPNVVDSDGDGVSDYDEINVYKTNPREITSTEQIQKPRLSNVSQNLNVFADDTPVFTGTSKPNHSVKLLIIPKEAPQLTFVDHLFVSLFGVEKNGATTMEVETDASGKFLARPKLKDGDYTIIVRSLDDEGNLEDETVPYSFKVDSELVADLVVPKQLDQMPIDANSLQIFTIGNSRPYLYGRVAQKNLEVHTTWASQLYSSSLVVDTEEGEFVTLAPQLLEEGSHELNVYGRDTARNLYTSAINIDFNVLTSPLYQAAEEGNGRWALILFTLIGLASVGGFWMGRRRKADQHASNFPQ